MATKAAKLTLKRHKESGSLYHEESGLVFKSATERLVTGRLKVEKELILMKLLTPCVNSLGSSQIRGRFRKNPSKDKNKLPKRRNPLQSPSSPKLRPKPLPRLRPNPNLNPSLMRKPHKKIRNLMRL